MQTGISEMDMMNFCHEKIIFVPGCLLCPTLQAGEQNRIWADKWTEFLFYSGFNIVQLPCPEASFDAPDCGLNRRPHGIGFYEALPGFCAHCHSLSRATALRVLNFWKCGYSVVAVLGIEHSPTCAVNYMYTHRGMVKRPGIFMDALMKELNQNDVSIPVIGINRRYYRKAMEKLQEFM